MDAEKCKMKAYFEVSRNTNSSEYQKIKTIQGAYETGKI